MEKAREKGTRHKVQGTRKNKRHKNEEVKKRLKA
jgi:hypothetical protein